MTAITLDGVATATAVKNELKARIEALKARGITPGLGTLLVGSDPGSLSYVAGKHRDCAEVGIESIRVDLRNAAIHGQDAEDILHSVGITVNRNAVPFDPRPPMTPSGVRIGTPALATRGFGDVEFTEVADIIATALKPAPDVAALRARVLKLTDGFPLYEGLTSPGSWA